MPVRRYRRVDDLPAPTPAATALQGLQAACSLSELTARMGRSRRAPRGVRRFRSVEEADAHRRAWEEAPADPDPG